MLLIVQAIGHPVTTNGALGGSVTTLTAQPKSCTSYVSIPRAWPERGSSTQQGAERDWCASNTNCGANAADTKSARERADAWCAATCVAGFCPEDRCRCGSEAALPDDQASAKGNARPSNADEERPNVITEPPDELPVTAAPSDDPPGVSTGDSPDNNAGQVSVSAPETEGEASTVLNDAVRKTHEDNHTPRQIVDRRTREEEHKALQRKQQEGVDACSVAISIAGASGEDASASCFSAPAIVSVSGNNRRSVVVWDTDTTACGDGALYVHFVAGQKPSAMTAGAGELTRHTYQSCVFESIPSVNGTGCQVFSSWRCRADCEIRHWEVARAGTSC